MRRILASLMLLGMFGFAAGCSEQTQQEASEAAKAVGEAAESAAKDTAENTEKAIDATSETIDDLQNDADEREVEPTPEAEPVTE